MKSALIVGLLALVAGGALGTGLGYRDFGIAESHFGPFRTDKQVTLESVRSLLAERESAGVPKLEIVGENPYNFGVMRRNASAMHKFLIRNVGSAPLELSVTGSTCKCTVGTLEESVLQPGETTEVELKWEAKTGVGVFGQSATLKTNDPLKGEVSLGVDGRVIDSVAAEPSSWTVGDIAATERIDLRTTLYNHSSIPIKIIRARWLDEALENTSEVKIESRSLTEEEQKTHKEATEAIDLAVKIEPQAIQGELNKRFRIEYQNRGEDEVQPPLELVLTGRIVGELSLLGSAKLTGEDTGNYRLVLGKTDVGQVLEQKFFAVLRGPKRDTAQLRIGAIDPADALDVEIGTPTTRGEMKVIPVIVRTKVGAQEMVRGGQIDAKPGSIMLETDDPEVAPIKVDVLFRIGKEFGA